MRTLEMLPYYRFLGKEKGPTSVISTLTHGNESCGYEAFKRILRQGFSITHGELIFLLNNPAAYLMNKKKVDQNLNRMFKEDLTPKEKNSYEYALSRGIKEYMDRTEVTAWLDIHSTDVENEPFFFTERLALPIVSRFPKSFSKVVFGIDKVHQGSVDGYLCNQGKIGICVECGYHSSEKSIEYAMQSIRWFTKLRGHTGAKLEDCDQHEKILIETISSHKTLEPNFRVSNFLNDFSPIKKGDLIGIDGGKAVTSPIDGICYFHDGGDDVDEDACIFAKIVTE